MPSANSRRKSSSFAQYGAESATRGTSGLLFVLYKAGPYVIAATAIATAIALAISDSPFEGLQAFCAFFLPVMVGAYALMIFEDQIVSAAKRKPIVILPVVFIGTIVLGRYLMVSKSDGRWLLACGYLGLVIAVFVVAQISRGASASVRDGLARMGVNDIAVHIMVAIVAAAGILVLAD